MRSISECYGAMCWTFATLLAGVLLLAGCGSDRANAGESPADEDSGESTSTETGPSGTDTRTSVSDDGEKIVENAVDINFGTGVSVTDDGDGSVTVEASKGGNGSGSPLYTTDNQASDRIVVAETASDIQAAIDAFAKRDEQGMIQLLPRTYAPSEPIVLKGTVTLRGAGEVNLRAPSAPTRITAKNMSDGNPMIRWRTNKEDETAKGSTVQNLFIDGARKEGVSVHGLEIGFVGNPRVVDVVVYETQGHGILFEGTQSAELIRTRISRCGDASEDWHGLTLGGRQTSNDFNRATVIGSPFVSNGPATDATPVVIRNGSTLRIKDTTVRTGFRGHGPMAGNPVVKIDGGDLVGDNTLLTTNIKGPIGPGLLIQNGGSAILRDSVVEKADPNIKFVAGTLDLKNVSVLQAKQWSQGDDAGDGIWVADSGKAEEWELQHVALHGNKGDGMDLGRPGVGLMMDISTRDNEWGINTDRLSGTLRVMGLGSDPDKPNRQGRISDPSVVRVGSSALE